MEEWRVENALLLGHEALGQFDNSCLRLTPWIKQFPVFSSHFSSWCSLNVPGCLCSVQLRSHLFVSS